MDPFAAQSALILFCDVAEPSTGEPYLRDPRSIAKKAEAYVALTGVGDTIYFGPEADFFVFDDVRYEVKMNTCFYEFSSDEGPTSPGASWRRATPATGRRSRAATSRFRRSTWRWTCAPKWSRRCRKWACPWTSTTMRWRRPA